MLDRNVCYPLGIFDEVSDQLVGLLNNTVSLATALVYCYCVDVSRHNAT